jgi:hypothetical protein
VTLYLTCGIAIDEIMDSLESVISPPGKRCADFAPVEVIPSSSRSASGHRSIVIEFTKVGRISNNGSCGTVNGNMGWNSSGTGEGAVICSRGGSRRFRSDLNTSVMSQGSSAVLCISLSINTHLIRKESLEYRKKR